MQAVVECREIFMDVNIGWPGNVHDAHVFAIFFCYRKGCNGTLFPDWSRVIGVNVPLLILGDPAYRLMSCLMKPYLDNASTTPQRNFNYRQSRARMVVKNAFRSLKGRWRCLLKRIESHVSNVPNIVASCVAQHNICEIYGDHCLQEWVVHEESPSGPNTTSISTPACNTTATAICNAITDYLY